MADFPDYYAILGVPPDASSEEIERAYARLRHGTPPGRGGNHGVAEVDAAARTGVEEAYDSLRHSGKRRDYDAWFASWRAQVQTETPPVALSRRAATRHTCPRCTGTGRTKCLVCEGRPGTDCAGCGGRGTHTCVVCLGLGTLSDAFYREIQDELVRTARCPDETEALGLRKVALAHHAAPAGSTPFLRTAAAVASVALVLLAVYAGQSLYRQPAPPVEISREQTTAAPASPSGEPVRPVAPVAPKVLSAPPAPASGKRPGVTKVTPRPRTSNRQVRLTPTRRASAPRRTPARVQAPVAVASPVAPALPAPPPPAPQAPPARSAPPALPPAPPEAIDREAITASVLEMVADWADALADGDINGHIIHYADVLERYFTKRNVTRQAVYQDKERFLATYPTVVRYRILNLEVFPLSADMAFAVFDKAWDFRTGNNRRFAGEEKQRLKLRLFDGRWKIVSEEELRVYWVVQPE